jgi:hypothetical protein
MRKGLLLLLLISVLIFIGNAQTIKRLKSWGYLESPPAPAKAFSTSIGGFQLQYSYPKAQLQKVNQDGTLTLLANLRKSTGFDNFRFAEEGNWAMLSYSESDSVFFYLTDGTAAKTKLVHFYKGSGTHQFDFTFHKGKAYITYDTGWNAFKGLVEINPADFKSKILFNKGTEDLNIYSVVSDNENLYLNYRNGSVNKAFQVNTSDGSLTLITDKLAYWAPQKPFVRMGNSIGLWTVKDTTVQMNGSNLQTKRMLLQKYNSTTKSLETLMYSGYFQATQPWYLGEINGKYYFFSNGDFNLKNCQDVGCSGNTGAYLWEVGASSSKLIKAVAVAGETYTYVGIKQVASDKIYLEITTKAAGKELWVASPTNLYMVKDHNPGATSLKDYGLKLAEAAVCGGKIAIPGVGTVATTGTDNELYISDGTPGNLNKLDVMPKAGVQSMPKGLVNFQNKILFVAADTLKDNLGIAMTSMYSLDLCNAGTSTGIGPLSFQDKLNLFPNPAKDQLNLQLSEPIEKLEIWSVNGTLVLKKEAPEKQIDVSSLKDGLYLIRVQTAKKQFTGKFSILK